MKFKNLITISLLFISFSIFGQNAKFSQIQFAPFTINPALTGLHNDLKVNTIFRASQMGNQGLITRGQLNVDVAANGKRKYKKGRFGVGIGYNNEMGSVAELSNNQVQLNLAYNWIIRKWSTIGVGAYFGYGQNRFTPFVLDTNQNPISSGDQQGNAGIDFGAGVLYTYKKGNTHMVSNNQRALDIGISVYHINNPSYFFIEDLSIPYNMRYSFFARGHLGLGKNIILSPALYYQYITLQRHDVLLGTYLKFNLNVGSSYTGYNKSSSFSLGFFYRWHDSVIANLLYQWSNIQFGVSFDLGVTSFGLDTGLRYGAEAVFRYTMKSFYMRPIGGRTGKSF